MNALAQLDTAELSPAKKAWLTRRLRDEARAEQAQRKQEAAEAAASVSPLDGEKIVSYWCDDPTIGCGSRLFVVMDIGPQWVQLFYAPRLCHLRVDRVTFDKYAKPSRGSSPRKTVAIIEQAMATWRQQYPDECELACRRGERAIEKLRSTLAKSNGGAQ